MTHGHIHEERGVKRMENMDKVKVRLTFHSFISNVKSKHFGHMEQLCCAQHEAESGTAINSF